MTATVSRTYYIDVFYDIGIKMHRLSIPRQADIKESLVMSITDTQKTNFKVYFGKLLVGESTDGKFICNRLPWKQMDDTKDPVQKIIKATRTSQNDLQKLEEAGQGIQLNVIDQTALLFSDHFDHTIEIKVTEVIKQ